MRAVTGLAHILGLDNAAGGWYLFWSGFAGDLGYLTIIGAGYAFLRRNNCHVHRCWRIGRLPVPGQPWHVCRRHHPGAPAPTEIGARA